MFWQKIWEGWKKFGRILGKIQTTLILSLIYYLLFTPIGMLKKFFTAKRQTRSYWIDLPKKQHTLEEAYKQY